MTVQRRKETPQKTKSGALNEVCGNIPRNR